MKETPSNSKDYSHKKKDAPFQKKTQKYVDKCENDKKNIC
jgi:hypothetical protein